jgi:acylphosphatase
MKKCLKISLGTTDQEKLLIDIQKKGTKLGVEGTIQFISGDAEIKIVVCGLKDQVDQFVDALHKEAVIVGIADINIEPFVKVKDYRGAFRIIE